MANQIAKSVIIDYVGTLTDDHMDSLTKNPFFKKSMRESIEENIRVNLEKVPHINGLNIANFFDTNLHDAIEKAAFHNEKRKFLTPEATKRLAPKHASNNPFSPFYYQEPSNQQSSEYRYTQQDLQSQTNQPIHYNPQPSAPAHVASAHAQTIYEQQYNKIHSCGATQAQLSNYNNAFWGNCAHKNTQGETVQCGKSQIRGLLVNDLYAQEKNLKEVVKDWVKLTKAVKTVEERIQRDVPHNTNNLEQNKIKPFFGTTAYTHESNIKELIIQEMGVSCPVCMEQYQNEMRDGQAGNKVKLPCNRCNTHACSDCVQTLHNCLTCNSKLS